MKPSYNDITERVPDPPIWYDENDVPRYAPFHPTMSARPYVCEVALVEVTCQSCRKAIAVAISGPKRYGGLDASLADQIKQRDLDYGDPPDTGCCSAGPTMNAVPRRVLEYWRRHWGKPNGWERDLTLQLDVTPDWAED